MRTQLKSVLSFLVVIVMVVSLFTACGSGTNENKAGNTTENTTAAGKTEETKEQKKEVKTFKLTMFTDWYRAGWEAVQKK